MFKSSEKWTDEQKLRAKILFREYPDIKKAYGLSQFAKNDFLLRILSKMQPDYHWQNGIITSQKLVFIPLMSLLQLSTSITMTYLLLY